MKKHFKMLMTAMMLFVALMMVGCQPEDDPQNGGGDNNGGDNGGNNHTEGIINGHAYVDLGLPSGTLWATCNVGAARPEEYGEYYAWGETKTKDTYHDFNYHFGSSYVYHMLDHDDLSTMVKYCDDPNYGWLGFTDSLTILEPVDDVASALWGGGWRIPSPEEFRELFTNCNWTVTTQQGVRGLKVTASNGNSVFFPAAGFMQFQFVFSLEDGKGFYWMNETFWNDCREAWSLYFDPSIEPFSWSPNTEGILFHNEPRYSGFSARPVHAAIND